MTPVPSRTNTVVPKIIKFLNYAVTEKTYAKLKVLWLRARH